MRGSIVLVMFAGLLVGPWTGAVVAQPRAEIVNGPEVIVANDPETMRDDPNTEEQEFNPEYLFSVQVRVSNDDDTQRLVYPQTIFYVDQDVDDACPEDDDRVIQANFVRKRLNMSAGQQVLVGDETDRRVAEDEEYWPMAIPEEYYDPVAEQNVEVDEGAHTLCTVLRITGDDPACDRPDNRTCVVDKTPFESYVRLDNEPPHITETRANPEDPRPGQTVRFQAQAVDNSTEPREDTLSYVWHLDGETKRGPNVQHSFGAEQVYEVELEVTDGFDTVNRTVEIGVGEATVDDGTEEAPALPAFATLALLAAIAVVRRR